MSNVRNVLVILVCLTLVLTTLGCDDPQAKAIAIFSKQGLTLLQPARDYIVPGGLVVLPKKGGPEYLDPFDDISSADNPTTQFNAIIAQSASKESVGMKVALGLLGQLIKLPIGLTYNDGQTVELEQMDTTGVRAKTQAVAALIKKQATKDEILSDLSAIKDNRVFVVQEVLSGKSISLKSTSNASLQVSYGNGGELPKCGQTGSTGDTGKTGNTGKTGTTGKTGNTGGTGKKSGGKNPAGAFLRGIFGGLLFPSEPTTNSFVATGMDLAGPIGPIGAVGFAGATGATGNTGGTGSSSGVSVGACRSTDYSMTLKSDKAIPILVRLNEVVLKDGTLTVLHGKFTFPGKTLAEATEIEMATATVAPDSKQPIANLNGLTRRPKKK